MSAELRVTPWIFVAALAALPVGAWAVEIPARSPFLPANAPAPTAAPAQGAVELKGIMELPDGRDLYGIYDPVTRKSTWVSEGETGNDFVVRQHNRVDGKDQVLVEMQGRMVALALPESHVAAVRGPASILPVPTGPVPAALTQNVSTNPTAASEAARLRDVVAEVQRRRALRNQAANTAQGGGASTSNN